MHFLKNYYLFTLHLLFLMNSAYPLCVKVRVPNDFFKSRAYKGILPYTPTLEGLEKAYITEDPNDNRVFGIPEKILDTYIDHQKRLIQTSKIPEDMLRKYSPYSIMIEYTRPSGRKVIVEEPIREAGVIEQCYISDDKITEKKGFAATMKEKISGPTKYKNLKVYLRYGKTDLKPCAEFESFEHKGIEIDLKSLESAVSPADKNVYWTSYTCNVLIIK